MFPVPFVMFVSVILAAPVVRFPIIVPLYSCAVAEDIIVYPANATVPRVVMRMANIPNKALLFMSELEVFHTI